MGVLVAVLGLPRQFVQARAAWRTDKPVKAVLPERVDLIHRADEIAKIMASLAAGEYLVSLEGKIGDGKSAVVREVAHRLAEVRGGRRKGKPYRLVLWLEAGNGPLDLADLTRALALATGDQSLTTVAPEQRVQALRAHLADHPAVLVIDNVRLTAAGAQQLIDFLKAMPAGSIALISPNTPRRLPGTRFWLEELDEQATRELLVREAKRHGVPEVENADPEVFVRIHRVIGGNPRAVELFVLTCARGGRGLDDQLRQLESGETELIAELYGVVWHALGDAGRRVLTVVAYLGVGTNLEQLKAAAGLPADEVDRALDQLWVDGLLWSQSERGLRRYTCAAALRSFVLTRVADEDLADIARLLASHFIEQFRRDWEDAASAIDHVDAIRVVIADLRRRGDHQLCFELFEVTLDLFFTLGLFDDRIELGQIAYESATEAGTPGQRSLALSVISSTHAVRGENAEAARAAERGLAIARESGSSKEIARQLRCVGFSLFRAGKVTEALTAVVNDREDAEQLARDAGDLNNMIDIQSLVGAIYWHLGRLDDAGVIVRRFLDACELASWERAKAYPIRELAELALMRRDFRDAALLLAQARVIAALHRDVRQQIRIDLTGARLHLFRGHLLKARHAAAVARDGAHRLSLAGEGAEAAAVYRAATLALLMPWRWLLPGRPRTRFTDHTVGGD